MDALKHSKNLKKRVKMLSNIPYCEVEIVIEQQELGGKKSIIQKSKRVSRH